MESSELRDKFLEYFREKGHKIVPSSSLVPEDKTVLLTSAGMQQFIPYLSGERDVLEDFGSRHLVSAQKCFRTPDIEEVGDDTHHTFFEMLGNWSIGEDKNGYFKEGAISSALDFLVGELGLDKERIWVTIFKGGNSISRDEESAEIWKEKGIPEQRIKEFGSEDNFWGPVAETGPCGPCSEIHYDRGPEFGCQDCGPNCEKCNRYVEIWNLVFMEYNRKKDGSFEKMAQRNVDTGIGFERLTALLQGKISAYETDLFDSVINKAEELSKKEYKEYKKNFRVVADHIRGAVFLASDGVVPKNIEEGYILRRILRRAIRIGKILKMPDNFLVLLAKEVIKKYSLTYLELRSRQEEILTVIQKEQEKFKKTLDKGLKILSTRINAQNYKPGKKIKNIPDVSSGFTPNHLTGKWVFNFYQNFGFPPEIIFEELENQGIIISKEEKQRILKEFQEETKRHKEISRAGAEKKFGGVGKEAGDEEAKFHTATHLLHQALREVLGEKVKQMGSDINSERMRFDFSYSEKMTEEQKEKVEKIVNQKIKEGLEVRKEKMLLSQALDSGALAFFREKYPEEVNVFSIGDFSKEICAGPHVSNTSELGEFKITSEKSSGAGVRRIKAILK